MLTLLPDLYAPTWDPARPAENWHETRTIEEILAVEYPTDAMILPYFIEEAAPGGGWRWMALSPRLEKRHVADLEAHGYRVRFRYGILDIDDRAAHASGQEAVPAWRQLAHQALEAMAPGAVRYDTRRGLRLVWRLRHEMGVAEYEAELAAAREAAKDAGHPADACPWNQLMRVPRGVRDGVMQRRDIFGLVPAVWTPPAAAKPPKLTPTRPLAAAPAGPSTVERFRLPDYVPSGERHETLKRLAASLRAQGLERDEILLGLHDADSRVCEPPVGSTAAGQRELENLADYYGNLPAGKSEAYRATAQTVAFEAEGIVPFARGDARELAERALTDLEEASRGFGEDGGTVKIVQDEGKLYAYNGTTGLWEPIPTSRLHRKIVDYAGTPVQSGNAKDGSPKFRPLKLSARDVKDAAQAAYWLRTDERFFATAPVGVVMGKEFCEVTPAGVRRHPIAPRWRARAGYAFPYTEDEPQAWHEFLRDVWQPEDERERMIQFFDEACGAGLVGIAQRYQKAIALLGGGANGKSTVLFVVEACFPAGTVASLSPHQFSANGYHLAELVGKRLNLCTEVSPTVIDGRVAADLKTAIRGEKMMVRRIYESPFELEARVLVIGALNALPRVADTSHGFFRSWAILAFTRQFLPHEQDPGLGKRVVEQDRPRIVSRWLRAACELVARGHYDEPKLSQDAVAEWRQGLDPILQFVDDGLEPDEAGTSHDTLYQTFRQWAERNGYAAVDKGVFSKRFADPARAKYGAKYGGPRDKRIKFYKCKPID